MASLKLNGYHDGSTGVTVDLLHSSANVLFYAIKIHNNLQLWLKY